MNLGRNIRERRSRRALTLDGLSRRAGVSRAMISDVERSKKSPTIHVLCQIASALECTVSELIQEPTRARVHIVRASERPTVRDPDSGVERQLLSTALMADGLEAVWYVLPPRAEVGPFDSSALGRVEHITLVEGCLVVVHDGVEERLDAGDSITYRLEGPVTYRNPGRRACRLFLLIDKSRTGSAR